MNTETFENARFIYSEPFRQEETVPGRTLVLFIPFVEDKIWDAATGTELNVAAREALTLLDKHFLSNLSSMNEEGNKLVNHARSAIAGEMVKVPLLNRADESRVVGRQMVRREITDDQWLKMVRDVMESKGENKLAQWTMEEVFIHVTPFSILWEITAHFDLNLLLAFDYVDKDREVMFSLAPQPASAHSRR